MAATRSVEFRPAGKAFTIDELAKLAAEMRSLGADGSETPSARLNLKDSGIKSITVKITSPPVAPTDR